MRSLASAIIVAGFILACGQPDVFGADKKKADKFSVGDPAPKFEGLVGIDDKKHSLEEFEKAKAVALVFTCNHCPVAKAYEDRLVALQKDYAEKGVQLVAINVNNVDGDKLPDMKERAEEKGFEFPYLYDPSQKVGRDYGAMVTPHVFLLDGKRKLAYVGPVDDSQDEAKIKHKYLRDAIDAVLAGTKPPVTEVKPFGCGIAYE
jgi:peroxiredoxin